MVICGIRVSLMAVVVLLYLSAVFNTVGHNILIQKSERAVEIKDLNYKLQFVHVVIAGDHKVWMYTFVK